MTNRQNLHDYMESTQGKEPHERVYFFHSHIYYAPDEPQKMQMLELHERLQKDFIDDPDVEVHTLQVSVARAETLHLDCNSLSLCDCQDFAEPMYDTALQEGAVGPHPTANLEVLFTRTRFTYMLCYLTFHVAPTFSTLVHELTADQVQVLHRLLAFLFSCATAKRWRSRGT